MPCRVLDPGEGGATLLWNAAVSCLPVDTVWHPKRLESSLLLLLWDPQCLISNYLLILSASRLLPKVSLLLCFLSLQYTEIVCPSTVSVWNQTCLLYLCSPGRKSMAHKHTADSTEQALAYLAVTYAVESQSFKSVTRFINRRSSLVSLSVPTPQGLFFLNIIT